MGDLEFLPEHPFNRALPYPWTIGPGCEVAPYRSEVFDVGILEGLRHEARFGTRQSFQEHLEQIHAEDNFWLFLKTDELGRNLFHYTARDGDNEVLELLAEFLGPHLTCLLNAQDEDGRTPLMFATRRSRATTVTLFCRKGPNNLFAEEIQPTLEDCMGKTALDYAKEINRSSKGGEQKRRCVHMVMELTNREDVRYHQERRYEEMEWSAKRVTRVGTASTALVALLFALSNFPFDQSTVAKVLGWSVVCLAFGLSSSLASLMLVIGPFPNEHQNIRATILYHQYIFLISFSTFLLALFSFLLGALVAPSLWFSKTPALLGLCLLPILTILTCVGARARATAKYSEHLSGI